MKRKSWLTSGIGLFALILMLTVSCGREPVTPDDTTTSDTTGPTITIISPTEGAVNTTGTVAVSGNVSDSGGIAGVYLKVDSGTSKKISSTTTFSTNITVAHGAHIITIDAFDLKLNQSTKSVNFSVDTNAPDTNAPSITIQQPDSDYKVYTNGVIVSGTAADNNAVTGLAIDLDGSGAQSLTLTAGSWSKTYMKADLTDGVHMVVVTAWDAAGNTNDATRIFTNVNVTDLVAPSLAITNPASDGTVFTNYALLTGTIDDNILVAGLQYSLDSGAWTNLSFTGSDWQLQLDVDIIGEGSHTVELLAWDSSLNTNTGISRQFYISNVIDYINLGFEEWVGSDLLSWTNGPELSEYAFDSLSRSTDSRNGKYAVELTWAGNALNKYYTLWNTNNFAVTGNNYYYISFYAKTVSGTPQVAPMIKFYQSTTYQSIFYGTFVTPGSGWTLVDGIAQAASAADRAVPFVEGHKTSAGTVIVDDFFMANILDIDAVDPAIESIIAPVDHSTNTAGTVNFTGTVSDDYGVKTVYACINNVTNSGTPVSDSFDIDVDYPNFGADIPVYVWAEDYAGKLSTISNYVVTLTNPPGGIEMTLVKYTFENGDDNHASYTNSGVSVSVISSSDGTVTYPAGNAPTSVDSISDNGWPLDTTFGNYFEFTVTANSGTVSLTSFEWDGYRSTTGPANWYIMTSQDSYVATNASGATATSAFSTNPMVTVDLSMVTNLSSVTVRIYANSATGTTGTFRMDNLLLKGKLNP